MKYKAKIAAIFLFTAIMLFILAGCQLAREDTGANPREDRLIGVFLTAEYLDLFDVEGYLNDNISSFSGGEIQIDGNTEKYQGRLYAALETRVVTNEETGETAEMEEYVFPDVDGIAYFSARVPATAERESFISSGSDEAISDSRVSLNYGDEANSTTLEGTVYVSPGSGHTYYFNPVYQSPDGRVYATNGSGIFVDGIQSEGAACSQTLNAGYTTTENGKTVTDSISVKISISTMYPPEKIMTLQMDANSAVVSRSEYKPGEMPETVTPEEDTEYFIVETYKTDGDGKALISRKLYGRDIEYLEDFICREDGVFVKQQRQIIW